MLTNPAACSAEPCAQVGFAVRSHPTGCEQVGSAAGSHPGGGVLACGAPSVLNSTPAEAVVSFEATVLLMNFTFKASCRDTPPPSQPATLFAMMLLVTVTSYHSPGLPGKRVTSVPLM